jgi:hypothetical protein
MANFVPSLHVVDGAVDKIVNWKDKYNSLVYAIADVAALSSFGTSASAASILDILDNSGGVIRIIGSETISSFGSGTSENIGAQKQLIFSDVVTILHSSNIECPGESDIITAPGTVVHVALETATKWVVLAVEYPSSSTSVNGYSVHRDTNGDFSGNVISATDFNTTSDSRLKKNVKELSEETSSSVISKLNPVSFDWNMNENHAYGFIAQEVEEILPELIINREDGFKGISYSQLIPFLVKEIQSLNKRMEQLQA